MGLGGVLEGVFRLLACAVGAMDILARRNYHIVVEDEVVAH